ncbi:Variant surface glycoprotein [Trypanosoma congolense IL3000]|uniref:Variant surface glycoprotein n=1 Tax=Trypanosoma congolense (strain IL3000) TaxID=1068625 RepID=F9W4W1_TRYCI|nr:Variant surface glycoprotein [Trypanosoma congolense IL3000]
MLMKLALVALVLCAGFGSAHPSAAEFNLFCRILAKANDLMYGPDYVYDENADRAILKDMEVLYNATTSNMNEFRKTLWVTKGFFEEHPPPTDPKNREAANREIEQLITKGEEKIEENKKIAEDVNKEINKAKLSVARGIFGEEVKELPKQDGNLTEILSKTGSIFVTDNTATKSCGDTQKTGKTLLNDFFCVCVGDGREDGSSQPPCSPHILPPRHGDGKNGWKAMKYKSQDKENKFLHFNESFRQIEKACTEELMGEAKQTKDMTGLLAEYVGLIGKGGAKKEANSKNKKIFGHSERSKGHEDVNKVTKCDGGQTDSSPGTGANDQHNADICVDYTNHTQDGKTYNIPWHEKFKNYTSIMKSVKDLEEKILKNRADLLLLKSQAWVAYSREKDDETSNLDDMNVSNLFDGARLPFSFHSLTYLFPFLFLFLIL